MATIRFLLRGTKTTKPIFLHFSINRNNRFERSTGLTIHHDSWSKDKGYPKQSRAENKQLTTKLRKLKTYVMDAYDIALEDDRIINGKWLHDQIEIFFGRKSKTNKSELVVDAINRLLENAEVRENQKGGIGLSKSRINDYKALKRIWIEFEDDNPIKVKEVNIPIGKRFLLFMIKSKKYGKGYAQRMMGNLKTVCYDAEINGIKTSSQLKKINSKQQKNDHIIYLSLNELDKIKKASLLHEGQQNARKWLLLGCWIGQRGNDLLSLTEKNIKEKDGFRYIELTQQKTGKKVSIPILPEVDEIIDSGWPRKISLTKFNHHIKTIAERAKLNQPTEGILNNPKTKRKELGIYPKWQLLASHVCRRSYCSNMYGKLPTPIIMQVTGHSTERSFLTYIGKKGTDYRDEWTQFIEMEKKKSKKESKLEIVKQANTN